MIIIMFCIIIVLTYLQIQLKDSLCILFVTWELHYRITVSLHPVLETIA